MSTLDVRSLCDTAAMHLGAAPFSVYNTLPADQIAYLFRNAGNRVALCEAQFAGRVRAAASGKNMSPANIETTLRSRPPTGGSPAWSGSSASPCSPRRGSPAATSSLRR
jgi:long-subunit acyl-CoA synthetase (AMP-forming)